MSGKLTVHDHRSGVSQKHRITEADEFDGSGVLFAGEQNAQRTQVTMDDVIAVAVADCLGDLTHVVAESHVHTADD